MLSKSKERESSSGPLKKNPSAQELEELNNNRTKINLRNLVGQK